MADTFERHGNKLVIRFNAEIIQIEPWGLNALRVRARPGLSVVEPHVSALLEPQNVSTTFQTSETKASVTNGKIRAEAWLQHRHGADVPVEPVLRFVNAETGEELLAETRPHFAGPPPRHHRPLASESFHLEASFKAYDGERIMGLGQPQHGRMDLKGTTTAILQQNTHVVIPFILSSRGYGFLWNNPAVGRADFASNLTRWAAEATPCLDYWIVCGDSPREILSAYVKATGMPPAFPDWASGFWQCKLRYKTQDEMLRVARDHKQHGLPLSCIVIDFFHWTKHGEWKFDPQEWPDPESLVLELNEMGINTIVSIWPTIGINSENWKVMREKGYLLKTERGVPVVNMFPDKEPYGLHYLTYYDAFNPEARNFHWETVKKNYIDRGLRNFWLDSCEPEIRPTHANHVRTCLGNGAEMLTAYPKVHSDRYAQGLKDEGITDGVLLTRSTWAGGQRAPIILWSGDVWSNWEDFRAQIAAACHAGMSGIGWWNSDIGGFYDGHGEDPDFRELLIRWFEFGIFSPVCRLHGFRVPNGVPQSPKGETVSYGRDLFSVFTDTGGDNEVWSYGPEVFRHAKTLLALRERLRPYIHDCMKIYQETGEPLMQPIAFAYPNDAAADAPDQYMFGRDMLVAPVVQSGARSRSVHLPKGKWIHAFSGKSFESGMHTVDSELSQPPVFLRAEAGKRLQAIFTQV